MFAFFLHDIMDNVIRDVMGESYTLLLLQRQLSRQQLGPVVQSLVSVNRWLRGIKTYRFPWYLTLVSTNHASSNPGLVMTLCMGLFSLFFPFLFWWAEHWFCILTTQSESASIRDEELQGLRQQHELLRKMLDQQKQVSASR